MSAAKIGTDEWAERERMRPPALRERLAGLPPTGLAAALVAGGALLPLFAGDGYLTRVAAMACVYALLAIGLTIVVGFAGMLDLGYVAFFGVGAYAYAMLASPHLGLHASPWLALGVAVGAATLAGVMLGLPALRLRGDYLAVVTLGFAQVCVLLVLTLDRVDLPWPAERLNLTGGPNGIVRVAPLASGAHVGYLSLLGAVAVVLLLVSNLERSTLGRAWRALRDDERAAAALGTPVQRLRLLAVALAAGIAGLAGGLFSAWQGAIFPAQIDLTMLLTLYAAAILGGLGSLPGAVLGAVVLAVLPELLRDPTLARILCYGAGALALLPTPRRRRGLLLILAAATLGGGLISVVHLVAAAPAAFGAPAFLAGVALVAWAGRMDWSPVRVGALTSGLALLGVAFELRLVHEPAITRMLALGALLVWMLAQRPNGLLGRRRAA